MGKSAEAFRTISEAAFELELPQHVLRFWETRFSQIKPLKRGGGRRYYRPQDVLLLKGIQHLLYDKGYTIKGVQRILKEDGPRQVISIGKSGQYGNSDTSSSQDTQGDSLASIDASSGSGLAISRSASSDGNVSNKNLSLKSRTRLTKLMRELLDCKRLLDNARE